MPKTKSAKKSGFTLNREDRELVLNAVYERNRWMSQMLDTQGRDIDRECGHPTDISIEDYKKSYERGDIAARVIEIFPQETWKKDPDVYEVEGDNITAFEEAWDKLQKEFNIISYLQRIDIMSGIGRFGLLLLGIDDGQPLDQPVASLDEKGLTKTPGTNKLIYLRCFDESVVTVKTLETDVTNPRYGQPVLYSVSFGETASTPQGTITTTLKDVHWSRVIHICDNRTDSEVYGQPRLKRVWDRIYDLKKTVGGAGEMFWRGGFPGLSIESQPRVTGEEFEFDPEKTKDAIEDYQRGFKRYLALVGMTTKSLAPQIADPTKHMEAQIRLIAVAWGIPWRVLMGSEVGQLASQEDSSNWNERVRRRQETYAGPYILFAVIKRLIAFGALPPVGEDGVNVQWPDLATPTEMDKASVAEKMTNAICKYVTTGADILVSPFHYLTLVLKLSDEEAHSIIEEVEERLAKDQEVKEAQADAAIKIANNPPELRAPAFARNGRTRSKRTAK